MATIKGSDREVSIRVVSSLLNHESSETRMFCRRNDSCGPQCGAQDRAGGHRSSHRALLPHEKVPDPLLHNNTSMELRRININELKKKPYGL